MIPGPIGSVECPECKVLTYRFLTGGKEAVCNNSKCGITRFSVEGWKESDYTTDDSDKSKSYNNSARRS